jgi:hypothetical protein
VALTSEAFTWSSTWTTIPDSITWRRDSSCRGMNPQVANAEPGGTIPKGNTIRAAISSLVDRAPLLALSSGRARGSRAVCSLVADTEDWRSSIEEPVAMYILLCHLFKSPMDELLLQLRHGPETVLLTHRSSMHVRQVRPVLTADCLEPIWDVKPHCARTLSSPHRAACGCFKALDSRVKIHRNL